LQQWRASTANAGYYFECLDCGYGYRVRHLGFFRFATHWLTLTLLTSVTMLLIIFLFACIIQFFDYNADPGLAMPLVLATVLLSVFFFVAGLFTRDHRLSDLTPGAAGGEIFLMILPGGLFCFFAITYRHLQSLSRDLLRFKD
jgi:hypothetical protein